jgi:uncharacterized membrane protein
VFSIVVLVAALGALAYEMVEDNFVNLIYARMFGWRTLLIAFVAAGLIVVPAAVILVIAAPVLLQAYFPLVQKAGALVLVGVGVGWLAFAFLGKGSETEEVKDAERRERESRRSLALATQLVAVEQAEIVAVLIPLVITGHPQEAVTAGIVAVGVALTLALALRQRFAKLVEGRFRSLKIISGAALVLLGLVLFFD